MLSLLPPGHLTQPWKIHYQWRFLAGKIIYRKVIYTMAMLNNQRVWSPHTRLYMVVPVCPTRLGTCFCYRPGRGWKSCRNRPTNTRRVPSSCHHKIFKEGTRAKSSHEWGFCICLLVCCHWKSIALGRTLVTQSTSEIWLVVWNICYMFSLIYWESSSQLTNSYSLWRWSQRRLSAMVGPDDLFTGTHGDT